MRSAPRHLSFLTVTASALSSCVALLQLHVKEFSGVALPPPAPDQHLTLTVTIYDDAKAELYHTATCELGRYAVFTAPLLSCSQYRHQRRCAVQRCVKCRRCTAWPRRQKHPGQRRLRSPSRLLPLPPLRPRAQHGATQQQRRRAAVHVVGLDAPAPQARPQYHRPAPLPWLPPSHLHAEPAGPG